MVAKRHATPASSNGRETATLPHVPWCDCAKCRQRHYFFRMDVCPVCHGFTEHQRFTTNLRSGTYVFWRCGCCNLPGGFKIYARDQYDQRLPSADELAGLNFYGQAFPLSD